MKRSITPELHRTELVLGYAQNKDEEAFLLSEGIERVWLKGRGAESLTEALRWQRFLWDRLGIWTAQGRTPHRCPGCKTAFIIDKNPRALCGDCTGGQ